jgi:hypothetical protein
MQRRSHIQNDRELLSLDAAGDVLCTDPDNLFDWLTRLGCAYRRTGLGSGTKLAYVRWVRSGLFKNEPEIMITAIGLRMLAGLCLRPASQTAPESEPS